MKKKFFTLFAAVALCGLGVVNAQTQTNVLLGDVHTTALKQGSLYHVGDAESYLFVSGDNGEDLKWGMTNNLSNSLWCVNASTPVGSTYPEFTFENKGEGIMLGVDLSPYFEDRTVTQFEAKLGDSDFSTWRFSSKYQTEMDEEANYLMSYPPAGAAYLKDSVAVLSFDGDVVYVNLIPAPAVGQPIPSTVRGDLIEANLYDAAPLVLTAEMFNTLFGSEEPAARKLNYIDPKIDRLVVSPFTEEMSAESSTLDGFTPIAEYVRLKIGDKYLRVDTTVYNVGGNPYLKFAKSTLSEFINSPIEIRRQHYFRLTYLPSADSLIINVRGAYIPVKGDDLSNTSDWAYHLSDDNSDDIVKQDKGVTTDSTYLVIQNLTETEYCLTIGQMPVQIHIGLGFTGCATVDDRRTTLQGLYYIKNSEGKYLQVPIWTDSVSMSGRDAAIQWVTIENYVDITQMPSFQWVVEKTKSNSDVSQITITNREYGIQAGTIQLYKDGQTPLFGFDVDSTSFIEVAEAQRLDKNLGYKYVAEDIAKLRTYTFEYLHFLGADGLYLSVKNSETDSTLYLQDAADSFELAPIRNISGNRAPVSYGYIGSLNQRLGTSGKLYVSPLERTAYTLRIKDGNKLFNTNKLVVADRDNRAYAVTSDEMNKIAAFFLKTNNTKDARNYYALVDIMSQRTWDDSLITKVGIADNEAWAKVEKLNEQRTSAFALEESVEPLYRRFNRTVDGIENGSDSFYSTDADMDAPVTLRFFRHSNPNDFLYEDAHSIYSEGLGINFLGVKHQTEFGLSGDELINRTSFYVDTAFVRRPATPGVGFDTPKPQYLLAVGVKFYSDGTIDQGECEPEIVTEGYTRGRYLVNATDSVYGVNANWSSKAVIDDYTGAVVTPKANADYIWNTKWERLAFVDAIHKGDTLYVLNGQAYPDPIQDFSVLVRDNNVEKVKLNNNLHKDEVFSFRLIDKEDADYADQAQRFMIESETELRGTEPIITPYQGGWVKIQNGVPVISRGFYEQAITDAEIFQVVSSTTDPSATSNEDINVTAVKVIAGNGNVTILNAAGKTVTISNILGQTVANTTISSDNVTIAAPKGIVVVAVQGEDAVKAIVK